MAEKQAQTETDGAPKKPLENRPTLGFWPFGGNRVWRRWFLCVYTGLLKDLVGGADAASQNSAAVAGTQNGIASQTGSMGGGEVGTE